MSGPAQPCLTLLVSSPAHSTLEPTLHFQMISTRHKPCSNAFCDMQPGLPMLSRLCLPGSPLSPAWAQHCTLCEVLPAHRERCLLLILKRHSLDSWWP